MVLRDVDWEFKEGRGYVDEAEELGTSECCSSMTIDVSHGPPSMSETERGRVRVPGDSELARVEPRELDEESRLGWGKAVPVSPDDASGT